MKQPLFALIFLFLLALSSSVMAQENDDCLMCHDDEELSDDIGRSLYVHEGSLEGSVHADFDCVDCHEGGDFEDLPHWSETAEVDCALCHEDASNLWMERFYQHLKRKNYEGQIPDCVDCHGSHQITPGEPGKSPDSCGRCHVEEEALWHESYHAQRYEDDPRKYPTCVTCHDPHFKGKKELMGATAYKQEIVLICSGCHQRDIETYVHSTHYRRLEEDGDNRAPSCVDCHDTHAILNTSDPRSRVHSNNISSTCDACHSGHRASLHKAPGEKESQVSCTFCHTGHQTDMTSIADLIYKEGGIFNKCNYCHEEHTSSDRRELLAHGRVMDPDLAGHEVNCSQCHVYHWQVPDQNGVVRESHEACANCHAEQNLAYMKSIHGRARAAGFEQAPSCVDCHGEANIEKPSEEFTADHIVELCSKCHADKELMLSFEVNPYVVEGFRETYHGKLYGLMTEGTKFAVCTNCHGYHGIVEPESAESSVNREHIVETCRQCHPKANENFITYLVHPVKPSKEELAAARARGTTGLDSIGGKSSLGNEGFTTAFTAADRFMKLLFVVVLSFFGLHTVLWFQRGIRPRLGRGKRRYIRRFSPYERFLHILVNVSFLILCLTGLPQSYRATVLGSWFFEKIMTLQEAQVLHYWAAAVTGLYFLLHLAQLAVVLRRIGWRKLLTGPDSMVPRKKDFVDFYQHTRWFFGKGERPRFDRWTYWEKFDYFAVFWGVAVIGLSGLIRWREEFFGNMLGGGAVSLADTVHKEEALLAAAFIFIVHFFNTHMRSEKFPMDVSIYTGLISEEELLEERPEQYKRLMETGQLTKNLRGARSIWGMIFSYAWGTLAFLLGLSLLTLIILGFLTGGPH